MRLFRSSSPGFSFVEVIVSVSIFAVATLMITEMYVMAANLQRQATSDRAVQQSATFLFDYFSKEIRNGALDYSAYSGSVIPVKSSTLNLVYRSTSYRESIYLQNGKVWLNKEDSSSPGTFNLTNLTGDDVTVSKLDFYAAPSNKCISSSTSCQQQRVTVVATIDSNTVESSQAKGKSVTIQTTFSIRLYDL